MPVKITSTRRSAGYVKAIVYGEAGVGKTTLCQTAPDPIIISAESGLLSLRKFDIPAIEVHTIDDLDEAYGFLRESDEYKTICIDSLSEIAEIYLSAEKKKVKDGRKAYGNMNDYMYDMIRNWRDMDKHVYFTAKIIRVEDADTGITRYQPAMPGRTMLNNLEYFFDEVLCLHIGEDEEGEKFRYIQTQPSVTHKAKDRSGALDDPERPDLTFIFNKICNGDS
jgi:phage nucleotide-binding protein